MRQYQLLWELHNKDGSKISWRKLLGLFCIALGIVILWGVILFTIFAWIVSSGI